MPSLFRPSAGIVGPVATGIAFYVAAAGALTLTSGANGIAVFWPANGILLAALLLAPDRHGWRHVFAAALASFAANAGTGVGAAVAGGYTAANIGEALLARRLAFGRRRTLPSFVAVPDVARFFIAAWAATLTSATLAALFDLSHALPAWSSWVTTDLLGTLIVTPTIITAAAFVRERRARPTRLVGDIVLLIGGVAATAMLAFCDSGLPLLFLPVVALLLATLRFGPFGAATSVAVIAAIGSTFTYLGYGPMSHVEHYAGPEWRAVFLQSYLLVMLATGLPLGALLAARDRLVRQLAENNRLLHLAERSAGLGHWWLGVDGRGDYFSPEVIRIHGVRTTKPTGRDLLAGYHADDRRRVETGIRRALASGIPFDVEARLTTPAGEERRVRATAAADRAPDGALLGVFGTLQDVTRQVEDHHALEAARSAAEHAARLATAAAETDALTGVANRRKITGLLADAVAAAHARDHALSVAIFDLDHFKAINDRFGHLVGDQVLVRVAAVVAGSLRGADTVGRIGGEEFVLVLPTAGADQAAAIAERVRVAIGVAGSGEQPLPAVTASIGIATLAAGEEAAALLHRADCALYEAKRAGRNALRRAA